MSLDCGTYPTYDRVRLNRQTSRASSSAGREHSVMAQLLDKAVFPESDPLDDDFDFDKNKEPGAEIGIESKSRRLWRWASLTNLRIYLPKLAILDI